MFRKSYDIRGYVFQGDIVCLDCATEEIKADCDPIFEDTEFDEEPSCGICLEKLD